MNFFHTQISPRAIELAAEALRSGFVSEGALVKRFEEELSRRLGLAHPIALNSGTSALHLALVLAGVNAGDDVIVPAQTFVATALAVKIQGATPVFADIQLTTGNIDPASIRGKITERTKAVIPVHWAGYPCDMDEINTLAAEAGLVVIEDAAHALGATYKDKPVGALSRFTAFSFQAIKHLTTGDGGALCCLSREDHERARVRRWFGIDRLNSPPSLLGERAYDITDVGYKYHMNDLAAAVGLGNLDDFPAKLCRLREMNRRYRQALGRVPGVQLLEAKAGRESACWLFTMLVERREDLIRKLAGAGIPASVVHQRIDRNTVFGGVRKDLVNQALFDERQLALPMHTALSVDDVERIIAVVRSGW